MSIADITSKGDRLSALMALRQKLASALDESHSGRDIASLALQLQKVLQQIDEIQNEQRGREPDELDRIIEAHASQSVRPDRTKQLVDEDI